MSKSAKFFFAKNGKNLSLFLRKWSLVSRKESILSEIILRQVFSRNKKSLLAPILKTDQTEGVEKQSLATPSSSEASSGNCLSLTVELSRRRWRSSMDEISVSRSSSGSKRLVRPGKETCFEELLVTSLSQRGPQYNKLLGALRQGTVKSHGRQLLNKSIS